MDVWVAVAVGVAAAWSWFTWYRWRREVKALLQIILEELRKRR